MKISRKTGYVNVLNNYPGIAVHPGFCESVMAASTERYVVVRREFR